MIVDSLDLNQIKVKVKKNNLASSLSFSLAFSMSDIHTVNYNLLDLISTVYDINTISQLEYFLASQLSSLS
jgi:hypothetical protein